MTDDTGDTGAAPQRLGLFLVITGLALLFPTSTLAGQSHGMCPPARRPLPERLLKRAVVGWELVKHTLAIEPKTLAAEQLRLDVLRYRRDRAVARAQRRNQRLFAETKQIDIEAAAHFATRELHFFVEDLALARLSRNAPLWRGLDRDLASARAHLGWETSRFAWKSTSCEDRLLWQRELKQRINNHQKLLALAEPVIANKRLPFDQANDLELADRIAALTVAFGGTQQRRKLETDLQQMLANIDQPPW